MDKCSTVDGSDLDSGSFIKYLWWEDVKRLLPNPTLCLASPPSHFRSTQSQGNIDTGILGKKKSSSWLSFQELIPGKKNPFSIRKDLQGFAMIENQFCTVISPTSKPTLSHQNGKEHDPHWRAEGAEWKRDKETADKFDYRRIGRPWIH